MTAAPPLSGIKVIDLTRYLAGPFATQILGDYGAEVIKIEPPDGAREQLNASQGQDNYFFLSANRSKKSIVLDVKQPEGRAVLHRLVETADVLIDNFRPGVIDAMGFGYGDVSARKPRIICGNVSGFGSSGPMRDHAGFDQIAQGMSGLMSVTGSPESGPTRLGIAICDLLAGMFAAQGILLAIESRHRTGCGQRVETSLLESIVSVLSWSAGIFFQTGKSPEPQGNHHPLSSPHGTFRAADRPFNIAVGNEAMWQSFVRIIQRPELTQDERFCSLALRIKNRRLLTDEIERALSGHNADYWIDLFNRAGIPSGPILTIEEMFAHPQIHAREMLLKLPHPTLGAFLTTGLAAKLSATPGRVTRPPLLGEHTDEVLLAHGYSRGEIARLREASVIR